ncbi:plasmid partition protein [Streptoverticillium reticulum]|uniref:plasmid partition protein n=1 Tax=Streptoverticillium reticulum TaxID=1433415 RepID=UPI0039BFD115
MLIANVSARGASGKTTDTGFMGHAFHEVGYPVKLHDADQSKHLGQWNRFAGGFPMPVAEDRGSSRFHEQYEPLPHPAVEIVDVGQAEDFPEIVDSVLLVADLVVVHMEPSASDFQRITVPDKSTPLKRVIARSALDRPDGQAPPHVVLFNRTRPNVKSTKTYRANMTKLGWNVLTVTIPNTDSLKQATYFAVEGAAKTKFGELVTELQTRGLVHDAEA